MAAFKCKYCGTMVSGEDAESHDCKRSDLKAVIDAIDRELLTAHRDNTRLAQANSHLRKFLRDIAARTSDLVSEAVTKSYEIEQG